MHIQKPGKDLLEPNMLPDPVHAAALVPFQSLIDTVGQEGHPTIARRPRCGGTANHFQGVADDIACRVEQKQNETIPMLCKRRTPPESKHDICTRTRTQEKKIRLC